MDGKVLHQKSKSLLKEELWVIFGAVIGKELFVCNRAKRTSLFLYDSSALPERQNSA